MATIGLVPLILMLITRTTSISIAPIPTHPSTSLVGTASLHVVFHFYFTRSGAVKVLTGELWSVNSISLVWAKIAYTTTDYTHRLDIDGASTYPAYNSFRHHGFSVRCITN